MPDIKLLGILEMCEMVGDQQANRKSDSQTILPSNGSSCRANKAQKIKADNTDVNDTYSNMPNYFRSSINRAADQEASQVLKKNYTMSSLTFSWELGVLKGCLACRLRMAAGHTMCPQDSSTCTLGTPQAGAGQTRKAADNNAPGHGWDI